MELMRHSGRKLTDKIYTDSNLLPTGVVIRNLPDDGPLTEILTEISGKSGQNGSKSVKTGLVKKEPRNRLKPAFLKGKLPKRVPETLVEVAGIEPETPCPEPPLNIKDSEFSVEALTEILTEISGTDRQMLSLIVQRWGSLSDELKRAVLRMVG